MLRALLSSAMIKRIYIPSTSGFHSKIRTSGLFKKNQDLECKLERECHESTTEKGVVPRIPFIFNIGIPWHNCTS